jgi:hypothetical protein
VGAWGYLPRTCRSEGWIGKGAGALARQKVRAGTGVACKPRERESRWQTRAELSLSWAAIGRSLHPCGHPDSGAHVDYHARSRRASQCATAATLPDDRLPCLIPALSHGARDGWSRDIDCICTVVTPARQLRRITARSPPKQSNCLAHPTSHEVPTAPVVLPVDPVSRAKSARFLGGTDGTRHNAATSLCTSGPPVVGTRSGCLSFFQGRPWKRWKGTLCSCWRGPGKWHPRTTTRAHLCSRPGPARRLATWRLVSSEDQCARRPTWRET